MKELKKTIKQIPLLYKLAILLYGIRAHFLGLFYPKKLATILFEETLKKKIDFKNPKDLNEKINWLKFNSDTALWTDLSDKYNVRKFIESNGLSHLLVDLYAVWENVDDINFNNLPQKFVLKANNGCASVILVDDKTKLDEIEIKEKLKKWLKIKYGILSAEPHYTKIKPKIICEEYLVDKKNSNISFSLIDYKIWCFSGEPFLVFVCYDRILGSEVKTAIYDLEWNLKNEYLTGSHLKDKYVDPKLPKPATLNEMISVCNILSKDFPQVRIDFYEVNHKLYFGEMTFTSLGGYMDYFTSECLLEMGKMIKLK